MTPTWRDPYDFQPYLFVDRPQAIFVARVNQATFSYPLHQFTFDTVTTGAYTDVAQDMTWLLGSSAGADDLGRGRVRLVPTSTIFYTNEASQGVHDGEINASDNMYLTVLNEYRLWTVPPRITGGTLYKDYNKPYLEGGRNYGSRPGPIANGGCDKIGLIADGSGYYTFEFSAADSLAVSPSSTLSSYSWTLRDGTLVSGSLSASACSIKFPPGRRYVDLTVTDSNGDTAIHHILVLALTESHATWKPITAFDIGNEHYTDTGGDLTFTVHETLDPATFPEGAAVFFFVREWYGGVEGSLAGPATAKHIKFRGWLDTEAESPKSSERGIENGVELRCISHYMRLDQLNLFPQLVKTKTSPTSWMHVKTLTTGRILFYLLRWHSTALGICPPILEDLGTAYKRWATQMGTLTSQSQDVAYSRVQKLTCDSRGVLRILDYPLLLESTDRTATVIQAIVETDFDGINLERNRAPREYWIDASGIISGSTPTAVFAQSPGTAPGQGNTRRSYDRLVVASQDNLNQIVGQEHARSNAPWLPISLDLVHSGDIGIDPAYMQWVTLTLSSGSNRRLRSFGAQRCLPTELNIRYSNDENRVRSVELTVVVETVGTPAATITRAEGGSNQSDIVYGSIYPRTNWQPAAVGGYRLYKGTQSIVAFNTDGYAYLTTNFDAATPSWTREFLIGNTLQGAVVDPFSPKYLGTGSTVNGWLVNDTTLYRFTDLSGSVSLTSQYTFRSNSDNAGGRTLFAGWGLQNWVVCVSNYGNIALSQGTWVTYTTDGVNWSPEVRLTPYLDAFATLNNKFLALPLHVSSRAPGLCYTAAFTATLSPSPMQFYKSTDYGATWAIVPNDAGGIFAEHTTYPFTVLQVPWADNVGEKIGYYGAMGYSGTQSSHLYRINADGSEQDISPTIGGLSIGPNYAAYWPLYVAPENRNIILMCGLTQGNTDPTRLVRAAGVFLSQNAGDTWSTLYSETGSYPLLPTYAQGVIAGDNPDVIYLWGNSGGPGGNAPIIAYSQDRGTTIRDKRGNIPTDYPSAGRFLVIMGG